MVITINILSNILYILLAILVFGILIFIHEFGHYITARIFHVSINEFSIGMGPKIVNYKSKKTEILYSLRLLPIGGFVSMVGEDEESDDENALNKKPAWQRFIIVSAGALTNIITGIILMVILVAVAFNIGGTTVSKFNDNYKEFADSSGFMIGDTIKEIDGKGVRYTQDLLYTVFDKCAEPVDITVIRNGEEIILNDVVFPTKEQDGLTYGEMFFSVAPLEKNFSNVISYGFSSAFNTIEIIWDSLTGLVTGKYGMAQLSGPVGATSAVAQTAKNGLPDLVYMCIFISMNLGIFNLLPLPALDGGRLVFILIEMIRRKPVPPKYEGYVHFAGIVILMMFMILITFKDIISFVK